MEKKTKSFNLDIEQNQNTKLEFILFRSQTKKSFKFMICIKNIVENYNI